MSSMAVRFCVTLCLLASMTLTAFAQGSPAAKKKGMAPIAPGGVRITVRNPLQGNWVCAGRICVCKPLACAAASRVSYTTVPTPARKPNAEALENFAKVEVPKRIKAANAAQAVLSDGKDKVEMLPSRVTKHLGYPSVISETKISKGETASAFIASAMIFSGPVLLTVTSASTKRAVAMSSLNEFIRSMTVEEGPSLSPGQAPPPRPAVPAAPVVSPVPDHKA